LWSHIAEKFVNYLRAPSFGTALNPRPCCVELALWDLIGKKAGLPIYKILSACQDRVKEEVFLSLYGNPEYLQGQWWRARNLAEREVTYLSQYYDLNTIKKIIVICSGALPYMALFYCIERNTICYFACIALLGNPGIHFTLATSHPPPIYAANPFIRPCSLSLGGRSIRILFGTTTLPSFKSRKAFSMASMVILMFSPPAAITSS
jgi:hypothetical protein